MKVFSGFLLTCALASLATAQTSATGSANTNAAAQATAPAAGASAQATSATSATAQGGAIVPIELSKTIDSKKAKMGDEVTARVISDVRSGGAVAIPRGSKLLGKITAANARANGDATSSLGIVFDRAVLKNGSTINLVSTIQAVIAPPAAPMPTVGGGMGDDAGGSAQGGMQRGGDLGGVASTAGAVGNTAGSAVGAVGNTAGSAVDRTPVDLGANVGANAPVVTSQTTGVVGIKGLELNSSASSQTSGSVFTSSSKSVKLEGGTRLLVNVSAASPGEKSAPAANKEKK